MSIKCDWCVFVEGGGGGVGEEEGGGGLERVLHLRVVGGGTKGGYEIKRVEEGTQE